MNKTIRVSSLLCTIFILIGAIFKMNHWPFAALALLMGILLLNFLMLPYYISYLLKFAIDKKIRLMILAIALAAMVLSISTLFQIQHWPGSEVVEIISSLTILLMFFIVIPIIVIKINKSEISKIQKLGLSIIYIGGAIFLFGIISKLNVTAYSNGILTIGIILLLFGIQIMYSIEKKDGLKIFSEKVDFAPLYSQILNFVFLAFALKSPQSHKFEFNVINNRIQISTDNIAAFTKSKIDEQSSSPEITKVKLLTYDVIQYIDELKGVLAKKAHKDNKTSWAKTDIVKLSNIDNYDIPTGFLIGGEPASPRKGHFSANELKNKLIAYKIHLLSMTNEKDKAAIEKRINLDFSDKKEDEFISSWEVYNFYHATLSHDLITLSQIQLEIKLVENIIVDYLSQKVNN
jgi:hypothetical protein